ncbi:hypothetical protein [Nostoc sp. PA-18-2419]|uniref:hypothetical protein n=1 Tax=Nostoc sp. PA-18-2419 TaxID=2575443 RepID=UPI001CB9440F|nr:hypothetical protein [Nostoc sp. PA-18-2419]
MGMKLDNLFSGSPLSQEQSILPKLLKAVLMWVIEVMSAVLVGNLESRFDLAAFVSDSLSL